LSASLGIEISINKVGLGCTKTHGRPCTNEFCVKVKRVSSGIRHIVWEFDALGAITGQGPDFERGQARRRPETAVNAQPMTLGDLQKHGCIATNCDHTTRS